MLVVSFCRGHVYQVTEVQQHLQNNLLYITLPYLTQYQDVPQNGQRYCLFYTGFFGVSSHYYADYFFPSLICSLLNYFHLDFNDCWLQHFTAWRLTVATFKLVNVVHVEIVFRYPSIQIRCHRGSFIIVPSLIHRR